VPPDRGDEQPPPTLADVCAVGQYLRMLLDEALLDECLGGCAAWELWRHVTAGEEQQIRQQIVNGFAKRHSVPPAKVRLVLG
jgi:hypothetical protein